MSRIHALSDTLRGKLLSVDFAVSPCACAEEDCGRQLLAGDRLFMRPMPHVGKGVAEPLCSACAEREILKQQTLVRLALYAEDQDRALRSRPLDGEAGGGPCTAGE